MKKNNSVKTTKTSEEKPTLQFSVPCDGVAKAQNNKAAFIGIFDHLVRLGTIPQFFIVNRWIYGSGTFKQKIVIKTPNLKKTVVETAEQEFTLTSEIDNADFISGFVNTNFEKKGVYWIEIYLNDELMMTYPFPVYGENN